ncbi:MAG: dephospho-CoA kinase [Prevotellaceae bacterium]|jgi:dephospho-CoA kinase|nr:dephospho-CoA kinase [Prevotellaceae bacterium]
MLKAGLTGGIGSGKSLVCRVFSMFGAYIYNADEAAKRLYDTDEQLRLEMKAVFGAAIYEGSQLNRRKLADIVFSDDEALRAVNSMAHPAVERDLERTVSALSVDVPYFIFEAAILFESGMSQHFDKIISVVAPEELRMRRVMERGGISCDEIKRRMKAQWSDEERIRHSDMVIVNDDKQPILPRLLEIDRVLRSV